MMKYLWDSIDEIEKQIDANKHLLLLLDYDGTLTKIAMTPQKAKLPKGTKKLLEDLKQIKRVDLGIVSGRSLKDIKQHIGIRNIIYSGNHGLEWELDGKKHIASGLKKAIALLPEILGGLKVFEIVYKGAHIENKNLTIGLHYRGIDEKKTRAFKKDLTRFIEPYVDSMIVKLLKGKKAYDIKPNTDWNKGDFIDMLIKKHKITPVSIFIGDDRTDEEAFEKLDHALTIKVGKDASAASYYLKDTEDTFNFLKWLLEKKQNQI